jgi:hypothetical protein
VEEISSIPWPEKNDAPFEKGAFGPTQAHLDWFDHFSKNSIIADAFKEAADKLVDNLATGNSLEHPDKFFFPVAYLYRHAFELGLKCIIRDGIDLGIVTEDDSVKEILKDHNLHKLWNKARNILEEVWGDEDKETPTNAEKVILQFHKLDSSGQAFRYAEDVEGKPHLENAPKLVDLVNLKRVSNNLFSFLDSCSGGLSNLKDCQEGY